MHELLQECQAVIVLETHNSVDADICQFSHPNLVRVIDTDVSASTLAWNFFLPCEPVPPLLRAIEDYELSRSALNNAASFALGFPEAFNIKPPAGVVDISDP